MINVHPYSIFEWSYFLTPLTITNTCYREPNGKTFIGITDVYLFVLRIARITRTNPWPE